MKTSHVLIAIALLNITGCSSVTPEAMPSSVAPVNELFDQSASQPKQTLFKAGKTLELIRVMDGAVCKNDMEGAKGSFLLYAYAGDFDKIKQEQGEAVMKAIEHKIEVFSEHVLQQAIGTTNLAKDPFAVSDEQVQAKTAKEFEQHFRAAVQHEIEIIEQETKLTLDVSAYPPSFVFFRNGCDTELLESVILDAEDNAQMEHY